MEEKENNRSDFLYKLTLAASLVYLGGVSGIMLRHNIWLSPDQFFIFGIVGAVFLGKGKNFIAQWSPFLLIFLSYEFFRGAGPALLKFKVHSTDLIALEQSIFGSIPTLDLQHKFLHLNDLQWYDLYLSLIYMSFFVGQLLFAYYLWLKHNRFFKIYTLGFAILAYMGFITYMLYPAMPPWMAAEKHLLPNVERILYLSTAKLTVSGYFPTIYGFFAANNTAAMPSLHLAIPSLMFLFSLKIKDRLLSAISFIYVVSMAISIIYLGEHYAIDGLAGMVYALIAFLGASWAVKRWHLF